MAFLSNFGGGDLTRSLFLSFPPEAPRSRGGGGDVKPDEVLPSFGGGDLTPDETRSSFGGGGDFCLVASCMPEFRFSSFGGGGRVLVGDLRFVNDGRKETDGIEGIETDEIEGK